MSEAEKTELVESLYKLIEDKFIENDTIRVEEIRTGIQKWGTIIALVATLVSGGVAFASKWFLTPHIKEVARAEAVDVLAAHENNVRAQMNTISTSYVKSEDFKSYVSEKNEKWNNQEKFNVRLESKVDRILERMR